MAQNEYIGITFPIKCRGRNALRGEVFPANKAIEAKVVIYQPNGIDTSISSTVECPHNTGGHGQRCKASHLNKDKVGDGVICPFSFDIPSALDQN